MSRRTLLAATSEGAFNYDPLWANVVLAAKMETPAAASLANVQPNSIISNGSVAITGAQKRFGDASLWTPGGYACLSYHFPDQAGSALYFGRNTPFTIDFWFYSGMTATNGNGPTGLLSQNAPWNSPGAMSLLMDDINGGTHYSLGWETGWQTGWCSSSGVVTAFPKNAWNHVALSKNANDTYRILANGSVVGETVAISTNNNPKITIGTANWPAGNGFVGYVDEFRITKGVTRYWDNFEVPTKTFFTR